VNGKVRSELRVARDSSDEMVKAMALKDEKVLPHLEGREVRKVIVVKNRLISIVV
jgi:leucyl-tRNA synthetase